MEGDLPSSEHSLKLLDSLVEGLDYLQAVRLLLSYPLVNFVSQCFGRTRDGEALLRFVSICRWVLDANAGELGADEAEFFDRYLICCELGAYDRLNEFYNYILTFEEARANKRYADQYLKSRNDEVFNRYVLYESENAKHVHFLYGFNRRYEIIKRKWKKQMAGNLPYSMLRHQKEDLSESELEKRFAELRNLLYQMTK